MDLIEKYAIAPAVVLMAWLGSFEWRLRNKVSKDMYKQNNDDTDRRLGRGVERFDKIDDTLKEHKDSQHEQGLLLTEIYTIVKRLDINNGKQ